MLSLPKKIGGLPVPSSALELRLTTQHKESQALYGVLQNPMENLLYHFTGERVSSKNAST